MQHSSCCVLTIRLSIRNKHIPSFSASWLILAYRREDMHLSISEYNESMDSIKLSLSIIVMNSIYICLVSAKRSNEIHVVLLILRYFTRNSKNSSFPASSLISHFVFEWDAERCTDRIEKTCPSEPLRSPFSFFHKDSGGSFLYLSRLCYIFKRKRFCY